MQLETELGPSFVKRWIASMGFDPPDDPEDLEDVVKAISAAAPTYTAKVVNNKGFVNIRIERLLESEGGPVPGKKANAPRTVEQAAADPDEQPNTPDAAPDDGSELAEGLLKFCEDWNLAIDADAEGDDLTKMVTAVGEYTWDEEQLSEAEVALLTAVQEQFELTLLKPKEKQKAKPKVTRREK